MATRTVEVKGYDNGYNDAIEQIKKMLAGSHGGDGGDGGMMPDPKLNMPSPKDNPDGSSGSSGSSGSGGSRGSDGSSGSNGSGRSKGSDGSSGSGRDADSTGKKGIVRAEDCEPLGNISDTPNEPGGMVDRNTADKVAENEGYEKQGGSESSTEKEWSEASIKSSNKNLYGNSPGSEMLRGKIEDIWKVSHDWKKELKAIVGQSISPDDKRQAYANKNVLVSQDRIARTDKDKYDNMDYMMAWIDSSGSMTDNQLKMCLKEVYHVALAKKPLKLVVVQCDTKIQQIKEYTNLKDLQKDTINATVKGRGGTDLKPCFDLLKEDPKYKRRPAELVMIFTDGGVPQQYKRDPRHMKNLCWVILDNSGWNLQYKERFTKCVHMKTEDIK